MVKLNGTRGKHRKTKMHKNKSKKIKRGGIALTREQLIAIIDDTNKISPMNIKDLIVAGLLKQKTLKEYAEIKFINNNTLNEYVNNNHRELMKTHKKLNHLTKITSLGTYNYLKFKVDENYIIYDTGKGIFREYTYSDNKFSPLNDSKYEYSVNARTNANNNKPESKIISATSIDPNNLLNPKNIYEIMQKLEPNKNGNGKIQEDVYDKFDKMLEENIQKERYKIYKIPK